MNNPCRRDRFREPDLFLAVGLVAGRSGSLRETDMLRLILLIVLILAILGSVPVWGYSGGWGYYPSGGLGIVLLIVIVLALMGRL
jgi:hypothetical protein